MSAHQEWENYL